MANYIEFKTAEDNPNMPGVKDIDPKELDQNRSKVCMIDVRQPDEFTGELGHIPGAQLIVLDTLPEQLDKIPKDKTVVFICRSGGRSARATAFAQQNNFKNVFNLKGGMLLWNELQLKVEN